MPEIARRNVVLLLLGIGPKEELAEGIGGITRLQKLLFLLGKETGLEPTDSGFEFAAYKKGPYSSKLYDDLEFLENLGFVESEVAAEATPEEAAEIDLLNFEDLMGDGGGSAQKRSPLIPMKSADFGFPKKGLYRVRGTVSQSDIGEKSRLWEDGMIGPGEMRIGLGSKKWEVQGCAGSSSRKINVGLLRWNDIATRIHACSGGWRCFG